MVVAKTLIFRSIPNAGLCFGQVFISVFIGLEATGSRKNNERKSGSPDAGRSLRQAWAVSGETPRGPSPGCRRPGLAGCPAKSCAARQRRPREAFPLCQRPSLEVTRSKSPVSREKDGDGSRASRLDLLQFETNLPKCSCLRSLELLFGSASGGFLNEDAQDRILL